MSSPGTSLPPGGGDDGPHGLRVTDVEVSVDPETLDRVFTVHAEEHAPITLRVDPVQLETILANLVRVVARSLN